MSITFETSFHDQLLYRGENKLKWRKRSVSVGRNNTQGKYLLKVQESQQPRSLWKLKKCKKADIVELNPLSYAVVRLGVFSKQCDVLGLLALGNSSLACHYFASDSKEVFTNLETELMACCDAVSFNVEIEAKQHSFPDGEAFLHVFQDRICLSKNKGSGFRLLGQWKICSHKQLYAVHGGVMLMTENSDQQKSLLVLKTENGHDIFSKFIQRFQELNLGVPADVPYDVYYRECDGNFNLQAAAVRHKDNLHRLCENYVDVDKLQDMCLSQRDESLSEVTLEHSICMSLKDCLPRSNLLSSSTIKSLNLWEEDSCHGEPVDNLSSTTFLEERSRQLSERNAITVTPPTPIVSHFGTHELRILELATTESSDGKIDQQLIAEEMKSCIHIETGDNFVLEPPQIPPRRQHFVVDATSETRGKECEQSNGMKDKRICTPSENVEKTHMAHNANNKLIMPRSHSFELVQRNRIVKLHHHKSETGKNHVHEPPPIPPRRQNFVVDAVTATTGTECQQSNGIKDKRMCTSSENMEKIHTACNTNNEFIIQRSRSFEIVQQNRIGKLHRHKSESSILIRTSIKELVQPVELSSTITRSETLVSNDKAPRRRHLSDCQGPEDVCLLKQESVAGDLWKDCHQTRKDMFDTSSCDCVLQSEGCCASKLSTDNKHVLMTKEDLPEGDEQSEYANLPRPSCYLYMNLPDTRKTPKETPLYVNHVFKGSSIKGCYENWQQHCGEDFTNSPKGPEEPAPDLPAPPLKPRRPPPRVPARRRSPNQTVSRAQENFQQLTKGTASRTPPPRPHKRKSLLLIDSSCGDHQLVIKDSSCKPHRNVDLQFAVFASQATTGQVWFVRIVMMRHDSNDATFKVVMERETACNYHLLQTQPLNISSDIVISLQHQCKLFELRTEDSQEIDYAVIENLTPGFWFVIEFHLQHMGTERENFVGSICVEPKDFPEGKKCPVNRKINLGITEEFKLKEPCNCTHHHRHQASQNIVIADYKQRKTVCQKLDATLYSQHNWRDVAGLLGFSVSEIHQLEDKSLRSVFFSPMDNVLSIWEQRDPECSLQRLVSLLVQIQRFDVVQELGFPNKQKGEEP